jgi:hypothetical protein
MTNLQEAVEIYLSSLPADEWHTLVCRVRPPDEPLPAEPPTTPRTQHANTCQEQR